MQWKVSKGMVVLLLAILLQAACRKEEASEEYPATTDTMTTDTMGEEPMTTDMGEPMGTDMAVLDFPPAGNGHEEEYPRFPWPPPRASATELIPKRLLLSRTGVTRLRDVDEKITDALEQSGYTETSYFSVPDGFALVTRLEQIEPDGTPKKDPERWSLSPPKLREFSLSTYLKALFRAQPGHYRVITFIVTSRPFSQANVQVTPEQASEWLVAGLNRLPEPIGNLDFSRPSYACTVLIYEFERATDADEPKVRVPGGLPGRVHLQKTGLWETFNR